MFMLIFIYWERFFIMLHESFLEKPGRLIPNENVLGGLICSLKYVSPKDISATFWDFSDWLLETQHEILASTVTITAGDKCQHRSRQDLRVIGWEDNWNDRTVMGSERGVKEMLCLSLQNVELFWRFWTTDWFYSRDLLNVARLWRHSWCLYMQANQTQCMRKWGKETVMTWMCSSVSFKPLLVIAGEENEI